MQIQKVYSLTDVLHNMLCDIEIGKHMNGNGERESDYHTIASDSNGNTLCASLTHSKDDEYGAEWYTLHTIDDITMRDCELRHTESLRSDEVLRLMTLQLGYTLDRFLKQNDL